MKTILVIANETIGGRPLLAAVRSRAAEGDVRFVLCVPQKRPPKGLVIYDHAMFDAAQVRVDLALSIVRSEGIQAVGEVGDQDPFSAAIDAVHEHHPAEIIVSTYPASRSGWMRMDLVERIERATGLPVEHVVSDIDHEGLPFHVTLAVANRTAAGDELLDALHARAASAREELGTVFIVVVPQESGHGHAAQRARTRLKLVLGRLHEAGLRASGMVGDPDPYTAVMNALQYFRVDDIVISTFAETKSGWLRADLIERVRKSSGRPVQHVVFREPQTLAEREPATTA